MLINFGQASVHSLEPSPQELSITPEGLHRSKLMRPGEADFLNQVNILNSIPKS